MKRGSALIDGEAVVEEESGVSNFTALQEALKSGRSDRMVFCAFDLLYLGGYDLTHVPLLDRKTLLAGCLDELPAGGSASASTLRLTARRCCRRPAASVLKESLEAQGPAVPIRAPEGLVEDQLVIAGYILRALFYTDIADWVLPHLVGRPLSALIST